MDITPSNIGTAEPGRPPNPNDRLIRKLEALAPLGPEEKERLRGLALAAKVVGPEKDVLKEGDTPSECCLVVSGLLFRYKLLENGARQIISFHTPGDIPDLQALQLGRMDHHLGTLARSQLALIPHAIVRDLIERYPSIGVALWRDSLVDGQVLREWITNVGHRTAYERLAHLICELTVKIRGSDAAGADPIPLPLSQQVLADATGMSIVHVNRTLQRLRGEGLITLRAKALTVHDWAALRTVAGFDPDYLRFRPLPISRQMAL